MPKYCTSTGDAVSNVIEPRWGSCLSETTPGNAMRPRTLLLDRFAVGTRRVTSGCDRLDALKPPPPRRPFVCIALVRGSLNNSCASRSRMQLVSSHWSLPDALTPRFWRGHPTVIHPGSTRRCGCRASGELRGCWRPETSYGLGCCFRC